MKIIETRESGYFDGIDKCEDILIRSGVKIKNE